MLFLQILAILILIGVIFVIAVLLLEDKTAKIADAPPMNNLIVIRGNLVKNIVKNSSYFESHYTLDIKVPPNRSAPVFTHRRYLNGVEEEVYLGETQRSALKIDRYGSHAIKLLKESLADIEKGQMVNKKA